MTTGIPEWRDTVDALNAIDTDDPERARDEAEAILLDAVQPQIAAAYVRVIATPDERARQALHGAFR